MSDPLSDNASSHPGPAASAVIGVLLDHDQPAGARHVIGALVGEPDGYRCGRSGFVRATVGAFASTTRAAGLDLAAHVAAGAAVRVAAIAQRRAPHRGTGPADRSLPDRCTVDDPAAGPPAGTTRAVLGAGRSRKE